jgi:DNA-binding XRE family transcriptional regulator
MFLIIDIYIFLYIMRNTMPAKNPEITTETALRLRALGEHIRAQRKKLKLNATVAAEAAGMSRITWYRIEKGGPAVTMGAWINAVTVVGLTLDILEAETKGADRRGWIPARIRLADYPELEKLAWHVRNAEDLSAREAMDIYERNQRHLDPDAMTPEEAQLIDALRMAFGHTRRTP